MQLQPNGQPWTDQGGNPVHAHGGHIIQHDGWWYWYGEDRRDDAYVACYRSRDLATWEFRRRVLTAASPAAATRVHADLRLKNDNGSKVNVERPKVLYNAKTGKFVMWAHYENGENYRDARACVATCDAPDGDFVYHGSFNPYGQMSRDCTLFLDDDGEAYFLSAARDNADLHVYRLTADFLNVKRHVNVLWQGEYREAPAVFKKDGRYFILSSHCTGWAPNQGKWACGATLDGDFGELADFGDATTFDSQPAFVLPVAGAAGTTYLYWGDRWGYDAGVDLLSQRTPLEHYLTSTYVVLPLRFRADGSPYIENAPRAGF
ncbi:MAG: family 43 glycosylhydrolase [Planctomycetes bacterium]|nr:family 43 glycosylhydrolase [Planctomycetota bacterium]